MDKKHYLNFMFHVFFLQWVVRELQYAVNARRVAGIQTTAERNINSEACVWLV